MQAANSRFAAFALSGARPLPVAILAKPKARLLIGIAWVGIEQPSMALLPLS